MSSPEVQRKLTAILSADVAGYSRLMGADEEATVAALGACREVFLGRIARHRGRVMDAKSDAILALLADKESRLHDPPAGTPLIPLDADCGEVLGEVAE